MRLAFQQCMPDSKPSSVLPSLSQHDSVLQRRIADRLKSVEGVDASDVSVVVRNRSATLFGTVAEESDRSALQRLAIGISGVLEVNNRLKLAPRAH